MKKRVSALLMAVCLAMGLIPTTAFAAEACTDGCFTEGGITYLPISGKTNEVEVVNPSRHPLGENPGVSTYTDEVTIPSEVRHGNTTYQVTGIGYHAFYGYDNVGEYSCNVSKVTLPEGITEIGEEAFSYCTSLSSLNIPSTVTTIGASAFANCTALTALEIPTAVTSGLADALLGYASLRDYSAGKKTNYPNAENVTFAEGSPYSIEGGCLYNGTVLEAVVDLDATAITVKEGTTEVADYAAYKVNSLESVSLPDTITTIGKNAFDAGQGAKNALKTINLPEALKSIEENSFRNTAIEVLIIPEGVTSIPKQCFSGVSTLKTIVIPSSVTSVGSSAFSGLKTDGSNATLIMLGETPPTFANNTFGKNIGFAPGMTVIIPDTDAAKNSYSQGSCILSGFVAAGDDAEEGNNIKGGISYKLEMNESVSVVNGDTASLGTAVVPTGWTLNVEPSSSDVVTISGPDADGAVTATANSVGTVNMKFSIKNETNGIVIAEGTSVITVTAKHVSATGITLDKTSVTLYSNTTPNTAELTATVTPADSTDSVIWSSSDANVATVDNGTVTAVGNGTATITATAGDYSATCTVTVKTYTSSGGGSSSSTYSVSVDTAKNGSVTVSPKNDSKGTTVTITAKPDKGYEVDEVVVTDKNGKEISVKDKGNNKYTFTMPSGKVDVEVTFVKEYVAPAISFDDVKSNAWYYDAAIYAAENGLMSGTGNGQFSPDMTTSRAMIWTTLARLDGQNVAVTSGNWYEKAQSWAVSRGVSDGTSPDSPITREQLAVMLYGFAKDQGYTTKNGVSLSRYTDASAVSPWAAEALEWAVGNGLISSMGNNILAPTGTATRAQVAVILMNFCENIAK